MIFKKDIGLLVLILVVGAVVAIINPRFLLAANISNTANQIGLFGILAIAQAFVIVIGGIELSVGAVVALLGVLFIDLIVNVGVHWVARGADRRRGRHADGPGARHAGGQGSACSRSS